MNQPLYKQHDPPPIQLPPPGYRSRTARRAGATARRHPVHPPLVTVKDLLLALPACALAVGLLAWLLLTRNHLP